MCLASVGGRVPVRAGPVPIESVVTTFHGGTDEELRECIDGADVGRHGWFVTPHTDQPQAAIFRTSGPVGAAAMDITLCFLSGRPNNYFADFAISATTDPKPSLESKWERLVPTRLDATGPVLTLQADDHLRAEGSANDSVFQLTVQTGKTPVTGFRVDVFPGRHVRGVESPGLSASLNGDFMLTEFRVEAATSRTTNIALGRPVKASHPVRFPPNALTDGLPGTFSHPLHPGLGSAFFFEIDLGAVHQIDHIALRNRGDGTSPDRLSRITLELYDEPADMGAAPVWQGRDRRDGSHPGVGEVDIVGAGDGKGKFAGRWLRLSSGSSVAFSPQFAEVEVYEQLPLQLLNFRADGAALSSSGRLDVPPGARRLAAALKLSPAGLPEDLMCRWRLRGYHTDWQSARGLVVEAACPPPGDYLFEAQVRHTDGEWNSTVLQVPLKVGAHFWQARAFQLLVAALAALGSAWFVRHRTRLRLARRMAAFEATAALNDERARISRDMHDEVGARLSQLAILQDIFAREHSLSADARQGVQQLAQTTRRIVASLDEVVWAVNPKNDTLPSLAGHLEQCATDYLSPVEIACRFDAPFEWPSMPVRAQVRHNLVLAFRESLQNILKHSGATEVILKLRLESSQFVILLADNGRGLPDKRDGIGKDGLVNMSQRLAAIGGTCEVRQRAGGGTEVEMRVHMADDPVEPHS